MREHCAWLYHAISLVECCKTYKVTLFCGLRCSISSFKKWGSACNGRWGFKPFLIKGTLKVDLNQHPAHRKIFISQHVFIFTMGLLGELTVFPVANLGTATKKKRNISCSLLYPVIKDHHYKRS